MIAYDTAVGGKSASSVTSLTYSYTTTGSDVLLVVNASTSITGNPNITSVTFDGVGLTATSDSPQNVASVGRCSYYYLVNAGAKTANIVISTDATTNIYSAAASYTGVKQFDTRNFNKDEVGATTFASSITSVLDNTWAIWCVNSGASNSTAGASTTSRTSDVNGLAIMDSNANKTPAGAVTLNAANASSTNWSGLIATFSSDAAGGGGGTGAGAFLILGIA